MHFFRHVCKKNAFLREKWEREGRNWTRKRWSDRNQGSCNPWVLKKHYFRSVIGRFDAGRTNMERRTDKWTDLTKAVMLFSICIYANIRKRVENVDVRTSCYTSKQISAVPVLLNAFFFTACVLLTRKKGSCGWNCRAPLHDRGWDAKPEIKFLSFWFRDLCNLRPVLGLRYEPSCEAKRLEAWTLT